MSREVQDKIGLVWRFINNNADGIKLLIEIPLLFYLSFK